MSLIQKDTQILLCKDIPFDNSYKDVVLFHGTGSDEQRYNYFKSKSTGRIFTSQSYQKTNTNKFRLEIPYTEAFNVTYCLFHNPDFSTNRWFYAFVTKVEYINNAVTEFTYEIDVMQTYFRVSNLLDCYIERQHATSDNVGDNIVKENFSLGDYIRNDDYNAINLGQKYVYLQMNVSMLGDLFGQERGTDIGQIYDGNTFEPITYGNLSIKEYVEEYLGRLSIPNPFETVLSVVVAPIPMGSNKNVTHGNFTFKKITSGSLNGYTPKNKKLYTYPYNYCEFKSSANTTFPIRYEFIDGNEIKGSYSGALSNTATFNFSIVNYDLGYPIIPVNMGVTCNFNKDFSIMHIAQTLSNVGLNIVSPAVPPTEKTTHSVSTYRQYQNDDVRKIEEKSSITTDESTTTNGRDQSINYRAIADGIGDLVSYGVTGQGFDTNTNGALYGTANIVWASYLCQPSQILKQIDDYFTRYGYATMKLGKPNIISRKYFNYIKTQGCNIKTNAPSSDKAKICDIFDKGVTFWHISGTNDTNVGNYSVTNSIV